MIALATASLLGLLLGARHAFEPDHLAAVSTLVAEGPGSRRGYLLGGLWGLGHTLSLLAVGAVLFALRTRLSPAMEDAFEVVVGLMLIALGARCLWQLRGEAPGHAHGHAHDHRPLWRRSVLVGMTHGLAGSGAMTSVALASMPSASAALAYLGLFGAGSAAGMALMTGFAGWGLGGVLARPRGRAALLGAVGLLSVATGLAWAGPRLVQLVG